MTKKQFVSIALLICVLLSACGSSKAPITVDLNNLYGSLSETENIKEMISVSPDKAYILFGINPDDCLQEITAVCSESLLADEIWLVEAKDEAAAERIKELADVRISQKADELRDYLPDQYKVVENAKLICHGNYVFLIIHPDPDALVTLINNSFGA